MWGNSCWRWVLSPLNLKAPSTIRFATEMPSTGVFIASRKSTKNWTPNLLPSYCSGAWCGKTCRPCPKSLKPNSAKVFLCCRFPTEQFIRPKDSKPIMFSLSELIPEYFPAPNKAIKSLSLYCQWSKAIPMLKKGVFFTLAWRAPKNTWSFSMTVSSHLRLWVNSLEKVPQICYLSIPTQVMKFHAHAAKMAIWFCTHLEAAADTTNAATDYARKSLVAVPTAVLHWSRITPVVIASTLNAIT